MKVFSTCSRLVSHPPPVIYHRYNRKLRVLFGVELHDVFILEIGADAIITALMTDRL